MRKYILKNRKYFIIENMQTTKQKGDLWEVMAIKFLQKHGYKIIDSNYKFGRFWEIDVIAEKTGIYFFIEVKYRSNEKFWTAEESITKSKLFKLEKSIYSYCMKNKIDLENIKFNVITITKGNSSYRIKHYKNIDLS